ncbi:MAG: tRNA preQ1(34) S-adenosylmethionine ribosyltransferase-isomerase QueA [Cytophagales bacterium]|nr:MAG: tRNA preQ1(34) S-adenosylmethionine ribosyltransferase-isomerase QueA [Cytophagales bacterium]TAF60059.1 MAG: tRNA preQ1(34) S-adenosylmethionine ribosyltransferase-isomerase QueA [Cytophagales bacterium]
MKLSAFKFDLPEERIAKYPRQERDDSRMMVLHRKTGKIEHKTFKDILSYFNEGDLMVYNNSMVFPARLYGYKEKTQARIEVFLLRELNTNAHLWDVLVDPARKIRVGNKLYFGDGELVAEVIDNTTSRGRTIRFLYDGKDDNFYKTLDELGQAPIPKDLGREAEAIDRERYQTIFAKHKGAVAAPTAGLHFTPQIVKRLAVQGVEMYPLTLHVGLGTFREVDVEDLTKHKMDSENYAIDATTTKAVNEALEARKNICAVGTTAMRALETSVTASHRLKPSEGWTDKFIYPPYDYKICKSLLTNFHKPQSTLLIMACAFGGYELTMKAYQVAIEEQYNFYSYGDAMLIL